MQQSIDELNTLFYQISDFFKEKERFFEKIFSSTTLEKLANLKESLINGPDLLSGVRQHNEEYKDLERFSKQLEIEIEEKTYKIRQLEKECEELKDEVKMLNKTVSSLEDDVKDLKNHL